MRRIVNLERSTTPSALAYAYSSLSDAAAQYTQVKAEAAQQRSTTWKTTYPQPDMPFRWCGLDTLLAFDTLYTALYSLRQAQDPDPDYFGLTDSDALHTIIQDTIAAQPQAMRHYFQVEARRVTTLLRTAKRTDTDTYLDTRFSQLEEAIQALPMSPNMT
ncbi:MAG: hypothetical protein SF162_20390 [bacterium]|nr:hypothetical protein [bacterium]